MLEVNCWPDLLIKSTVEPKRCLILDVRKSSLVEDRRVPENRNEFPFPLPSCLYGAIFPLLLLCLPRELGRLLQWLWSLSCAKPSLSLTHLLSGNVSTAFPLVCELKSVHTSLSSFILLKHIHICYSPDGRSVVGKTVPKASGGIQDLGHSFSQYGPTLAGE